MRLFRVAASCAATFFCLSSYAYADTTGTVRGIVSDPRPLPSDLVVQLQGEGATLIAKPDASGAFAFPRVPFGRYVVATRAQGQTGTSSELVVSSDSVVTIALTINPPLRQIGQTRSSMRSVTTTPVSRNALGAAQIAALPANTSLNSLIETVPGIVTFSYNEPVAHGYHGITYELDGAPLPQSTSSQFSEIIDPRNIDSLEVFTGSFPAEFGGSRQGAVVNIISRRATDATRPAEGTLSLTAGSYGAKQAALSESLKIGVGRLFVNANMQRSMRGIDSPTFVPNHDAGDRTDQFVRYVAPSGARDTLAVNFSNQTSLFQIPLNTSASPNDSVVNAAGTDDVQREYDRFANVSFTHASRDGNGYFQAIPWYHRSRIAYDGDIARDLLGTSLDTTQQPPALTALNGLRENRVASYVGLRLAAFHASPHHALKYGIEGTSENFRSEATIVQASATVPGAVVPFPDTTAAHGSLFGAYVQENWSPSRAVSVRAGFRYDRSTGFTQGNQLSPRVEINLAPDTKNVVHFSYGRLYAAPQLEDTRRDAVVTGLATNAAPIYDLQPEHDSYVEGGIAHTFAPSLTGYANYWRRNVANVLDTTQIFPTPIFAVFNNAVGRAEGAEFRLERSVRDGDSWYFSGSVSVSEAAGISGGTFLFAPSANANAAFQPEDHDQTFTASAAYTHRFGVMHRAFVTVQPEYGTGYPVQFQDGSGRLPAHLTLNAALGREPGAGVSKSLGYSITAENLTNKTYLLKVNNGFNTTQYAPGARILFRVTLPI